METKRSFLLSLIIPGVIAVALAIILIISISSEDSENKIGKIIGTIVAVILIYLVAVQLIWNEGIVSDIFMFFMVKPFSRLGLIFELSLDGIIWLITVKLILAILGGIISVLVALFGIGICMVFAPFTFPFALKETLKDIV